MSQNLLNTAEAASYLGLKPCTLEKWRCVGGGPVYRKIGKAVRYTEADLSAFLDASRMRSTSQEVAA